MGGTRTLQGRGRAGSWSAGVEEPSEVWWDPEWQEHWYQHPADTRGVSMDGFSVCNKAVMGSHAGHSASTVCHSSGPRGAQPPSSGARGCWGSGNVQLAGSGHPSHLTCSQWPLLSVTGSGAQPGSVAKCQARLTHSKADTATVRGKAALLITVVTQEEPRTGTKQAICAGRSDYWKSPQIAWILLTMFWP